MASTLSSLHPRGVAKPSHGVAGGRPSPSLHAQCADHAQGDMAWQGAVELDLPASGRLDGHRRGRARQQLDVDVEAVDVEGIGNGSLLTMNNPRTSASCMSRLVSTKAFLSTVSTPLIVGSSATPAPSADAITTPDDRSCVVDAHISAPLGRAAPARETQVSC